MYETLSSDLFGVSSDELLCLATTGEEGETSSRRCDLYTGFMRMQKLNSPERQIAQPRLRLAADVLCGAWLGLGKTSLASTIKEVLIGSGILTRLEGEGAFGLARAGNILKAHRIIESLERDRQLGPAQASSEFSSQIAIGLKEPPGALSGSADSVVRVMTIHASKGLEFPIVALAEFSGSKRNRQTLAIEAVRGKAFASLGIGRTKNAYESIKKHTEKQRQECPIEGDELTRLNEAASLIELRSALEAYGAVEEHSEDQRKLYVGLTRASEAFICAMTVKLSAKNNLNSYGGLVDDVRRALWKDGDFPEGEARLSYGGSEPARYERQDLDRMLCPDEEASSDQTLCSEHSKHSEHSEYDDMPRSKEYAEGEFATEGDRSLPKEVFPPCEEEASSEHGFFIPRRYEAKPLVCVLDRAMREHVFSYSSLEAGLSPEKELVFGTEEYQGKGEVGKAVDLGTAFHRLAQLFVETGITPSRSDVQRMIILQKLTETQAVRLEHALHRWLKSGVQNKISQYPFVRAELPFFIELGDGYLEGEIDLFCCDAKKKSAFIIDYKAGGFDTEIETDLYDKHVLQASCYAYASLLQGFDSVELCFVRVEQESLQEDQEPQSISYRFCAADKDELREKILKARIYVR